MKANKNQELRARCPIPTRYLNLYRSYKNGGCAGLNNTIYVSKLFFMKIITSRRVNYV